MIGILATATDLTKLLAIPVGLLYDREGRLIMGTISEVWGFKGAFRMAAVLALLGAMITVGTSRRGGGDH